MKVIKSLKVWSAGSLEAAHLEWPCICNSEDEHELGKTDKSAFPLSWLPWGSQGKHSHSHTFSDGICLEPDATVYYIVANWWEPFPGTYFKDNAKAADAFHTAQHSLTSQIKTLLRLKCFHLHFHNDLSVSCDFFKRETLGKFFIYLSSVWIM